MNDDVKKLEPTLRIYDQELSSIEQQREAMEREILRLQSELKRLAGRRVGWLQMSAVTKNGIGLPLTDEERSHLPAEVVEVNAVPVDLCKGQEIVEAAEAYLRWRNEPATQGEVMKGMKEGGFEDHYQSFDNSLRSAMKRSGMFKRYKNDENVYVWALPEWINRAPNQVDGESASEKPNLTVVGRSEAKAKSA
jgi:hypothetical protein